jgi:hypothetical protein
MNPALICICYRLKLAVIVLVLFIPQIVCAELVSDTRIVTNPPLLELTRNIPYTTERMQSRTTAHDLSHEASLILNVAYTYGKLWSRFRAAV